MDDLALLIDAWPVTNPGQVKTYNEDFVAVHEPEDPQVRAYSGYLYVVADGTGEAASGLIASRYAALKIISEYYKSNDLDLGVRLRRAILDVNGELYRYVERNPELKKISTTVAAIAIRGEQYHVASVGDSRVYLVRNAQITQITRDHSLVAGLVDQGTVSSEEAREHPQRDVLLRNLGSQPSVEVDLYDGRIAPDDRLILSTNGLTRHVDGQELANLAVESQPTTAAERMVSVANERGGRDNVSAIVLGARMGIPTPRTPLPFSWDGLEPILGETPDLSAPTAEPERPAAPLEHPTAPPIPPPQQPEPISPQTTQPTPVTQPLPTQPAFPPSATQAAASAADDTAAHPRPPHSQPAAQPSPYSMEPIPQPGQPKSYRPADAGGSQPSAGSGTRNILIGVIAVIVLAVAGVVAAVTLLPVITGGASGAETGEEGGAIVITEGAPEAAAGITLPPPTLPQGGSEQATPEPTQQLVPPGMTLVEAGEFSRGISDDEVTLAVRNCIQEGGGACPPEFYQDAQPQQSVALSAFYIDRTEVSNADYALCVAGGNCDPPVDLTRYDDPAYTNHPVTNITWAQAANYCASIGKRLPTEAEWEKAARGADGRVWPWGDAWEPGKANTLAAQLGGPSTVEAFAGDVSPYGIIGLSGNVSEWINDWYQGSYDNLALVDPLGPLAQIGEEPIKVARGGSYDSLSSEARGAHRLGVRAGAQADWLGFRCAASLTAGPIGAPVEGAPAEGEGETVAPEATAVPTPTPQGGTAPEGGEGESDSTAG